MMRMLKAAGLALGLGLGTAACTDGYGYSGVSVGIGPGYYDGYAPGYASYYGWYGDYYYPGSGVYVYDRYRRPFRWNSNQQRFWQGRQQFRGQLYRGPGGRALPPRGGGPRPHPAPHGPRGPHRRRLHRRRA